MKKSVGIIVPFYNGYAYLKSLIGSIDRAGLNLHCKLFIIDNSTRNLALDIPTGIGIDVEIVRERPGIGYGKACNRGFELCRQEGFDYLIVANQDGYFSENMIRQLLLPFERDDKIAISAPLLKEYGHQGVEAFFIKYYLSQIPEMLPDLLSMKLCDFYEMKVISGACFAFRIDDEKYPWPYLFDPVFHMYYEDEDLCRRILTTGRKIVLVPRDADFYHQHSQTTDHENRDAISKDRLLGEMIYRLKDPRKSILASLYGIFASTASQVLFHLLRGEGRLLFMHLQTSIQALLLAPRISESKKREVCN